MVKTQLVPPDGGYAWVILGAYAMHHLVAIPIMQGFGLLFKDVFRDLQFSATDISFVLNTNAAFTMFIGIINGPLIKQFGYRKVSLVAATCLSVGVVLTAHAYTFTHFIITYGIITAAGLGIGLSSYSVALNSYFMKRRSKAAGYGMTIAGFGPIFMPQLISFLLWCYGFKGAVMIIGAIGGHAFVSASLLQPIKWHRKEEIIEDDENEEESEKENLLERENGDHTYKIKSTMRRRKITNSFDEDIHMEGALGIDTPLSGSMLSIYTGFPERSQSVSSRRNPYSRSNSRHTEEVTKTVLFEDEENGKELPDRPRSNSLNQNSNPKCLRKISIGEKSKLESLTITFKDKNPEENTKVGKKVYDTEMTVEMKEKSETLLKRIWKRIVDIFDLTLLKDKTYLNIMIGMSFAVFAEMNFSLLTPFIMHDRGLDTQQIATFMSTVSVVDICFRFIAPYIGDYFKQPIRNMYLWALVVLILSRFSLLLAGTNYTALLCCAGFLGLAKGFRTVYWSLVIPSSVSIERLASALGLQSAFNSIFVVIGGSFLGVIRDVTGSYGLCIFIINCVTFTTIVMWCVEFMYKRYKSKKKASDAEDIQLQS